jgi:hypothetical protein
MHRRALEMRTEAQPLNVEALAEEDSAPPAVAVDNADRLSQRNMKRCGPQLPGNLKLKTTAPRIACRPACPE